MKTGNMSTDKEIALVTLSDTPNPARDSKVAVPKKDADKENIIGEQEEAQEVEACKRLL